MKLSIERGALLRSLAHVQNVVERRTTIPILSNVKLPATARAGLTATDMDLSLAAREESAGHRAGRDHGIGPPAVRHRAQAAGRQQRRLEQAASGGEITLRAGRSVFNLPTLPADEFPAMDAESLDVSLRDAGDGPGAAVDKTRFAISTEETRYYLNGMHLHATRGGAAADAARRRHRRPPSRPGRGRRCRRAPSDPADHRAAQDRGRAAQADRGRGRGGRHRRCRRPGSASPSAASVLVSRLIDGTFPDYERVIPSGNDKVATMARPRRSPPRSTASPPSRPRRPAR